LNDLPAQFEELVGTPAMLDFKVAFNVTPIVV
jgi:hypothetical protein